MRVRALLAALTARRATTGGSSRHVKWQTFLEVLRGRTSDLATLLKSFARPVATHRSVAPLLSAVLRRAGGAHLGRRLDLLRGGVAPDTCTVQLPAGFHTTDLAMRSVGGRDQVAMRLFTHGWKSFEEPLPAFMASAAHDGDVILDIGANTGFYALLAASVGSHVSVHAFEPVPAVAELLQENVRINLQGRQITVVRDAVDHENGSAALYLPLSDHGLVETSASLSQEFRRAHSDVIQVKKTTIDEYVARESLTRVDIIKIDVEGLEDRVLEGARLTLARHRPAVFLEVLDCFPDWPADIRKLEAVRQEAGYIAVQLGTREITCVPHLVGNEKCLNQALWPQERLEDLAALCQRLNRRLIVQADSTRETA